MFLDAGCGLAPYAKFFAKTFPNAISIGIDITDTIMLAKDSNLKNLHLVRGDLRNPPIRHGVVDIGWSYGVLHHTPDTKDAFFKLQKYIKKLGKMYVWVYSIHRTKYSFLTRKFLFKSYKYPAIINLFLSYIIALIPFVIYRVHFIYRSFNKKVRPLLKKHKYLNLVIGIHDSLVPEYQSYHSKKELVSWFKEANFNNIKIVGDVGVVGTRSNKSLKKK